MRVRMGRRAMWRRTEDVSTQVKAKSCCPFARPSDRLSPRSAAASRALQFQQSPRLSKWSG